MYLNTQHWFKKHSKWGLLFPSCPGTHQQYTALCVCVCVYIYIYAINQNTLKYTQKLTNPIPLVMATNISTMNPRRKKQLIFIGLTVFFYFSALVCVT